MLGQLSISAYSDAVNSIVVQTSHSLCSSSDYFALMVLDLKVHEPCKEKSLYWTSHHFHIRNTSLFFSPILAQILVTPSHLVKRQGGIVVDKGFEQQHSLI